ncbi:MAG: sodium-independent anion transporter [Rhodobacter sp.]|nr:sodium-independent anion transporter [Rhodobacter sp.]
MQDWLIVLGILILTMSVGILPAIGAGLGLAMLTFVIGFIRLPVIRSVSSAAIRHSILDRPAAENDLLRRVGDQIRILHLQGPLFFGSVEQLIAHLRRLPEAIAGISGPPRALILDFTEVSTFDSSACAAMQKLGNTMQDRGVAVHLAGMPAQLETMFHRWGLDLAGGMFQVWPSFDVALEVCETRLLAAQPDRPAPPVRPGRGGGGGPPRAPPALGAGAGRLPPPGGAPPRGAAGGGGASSGGGGAGCS